MSDETRDGLPGRKIDWAKMGEQVRAMTRAFEDHITSPPGCTCDPKPTIAYTIHDEVELAGVDRRCVAHAAMPLIAALCAQAAKEVPVDPPNPRKYEDWRAAGAGEHVTARSLRSLGVWLPEEVADEDTLMDVYEREASEKVVNVQLAFWRARKD